MTLLLISQYMFPFYWYKIISKVNAQEQDCCAVAYVSKHGRWNHLASRTLTIVRLEQQLEIGIIPGAPGCSVH